ncbi:MAG: hypothetical protein ABSF70_16635 [Terracidiphilus sp.]|jgi:hypothetical protein
MPSDETAPKTELIFRDLSKQSELEPLCRMVLDKFQLPQRSLICIFDEDERPEFTRYFGEGFCGFFAPVRQFGLRGLQWPQKILNHVWISDGWGHSFGCDAVIYLRYRTCASPIGAVITFAHELQHFMQYGFSYRAWRAVGRVKEVYAGEPLAPWRFPCEYEAQLVSKRVANEIPGVDVVMSYAEQKTQEENDPEKWRFFKGLDPEEPFDLLERTKPLVNKYREILMEKFPARNNDEPDFTKDNWWE